MLVGISHDAILNAIDGLEPLELDAVVLLHEHRVTGAMSDDTARISTAVEQLTSYADRCDKVLRQVERLSPVPAAHYSEGFAL